MPTLYDNFSQVKKYIDQEKPDLTSYVTKTELANASYVTSTTLENASYATQTYVVDYVATYGSGSTVIDENIIPKETNTYTLGDEDYFYNATYTSSINFKPYNMQPKDSQIIIKSNYDLNIARSQIYIKFGGDGANNTYAYYVINKDYCGPWSNKSIDFGNKKNRWNAFNARAAYAYNMYVGWPEQNIYDVFPTYSYVTDYVATYASTPDLSTYVTKTELSGMSYATQTYVADYVATYGGGSGGGDVTQSDLAFVKQDMGAVLSYSVDSLVLPIGAYSLAMGSSSYAAGARTIVTGENCAALADNAIVGGKNSTTYGWCNFALGRNLKTSNYGEVAIGFGNYSRADGIVPDLPPMNPSIIGWSTNTLFSIGIGGTNVTPGAGINAIEVKRNGDIYCYGFGGNTGQGDGNTLQYMLNKLFSYDSSTGTLTISTL